MNDDKKLDKILKNTEKTNVLIESIGFVVNSVLVGLFTVVMMKILISR